MSSGQWLVRALGRPNRAAKSRSGSYQPAPARAFQKSLSTAHGTMWCRARSRVVPVGAAAYLFRVRRSATRTAGGVEYGGWPGESGRSLDAVPSSPRPPRGPVLTNGTATLPG